MSVECANFGYLAMLLPALRRLIQMKGDAVPIGRFKREGKVQTLLVVSVEPLILSWMPDAVHCTHFRGDDALRELNTISERTFFAEAKKKYGRWNRGKW